MKKEITIKLMLETDDEYMRQDDFIRRDLIQEISCCSNSYEIHDIIIRDLSIEDLKQIAKESFYKLTGVSFDEMPKLI